MRPLPYQNRVIAGLIIALLLLGTLTLVACQSATRLRDVIARVDHAACAVISLRGIAAQLEIADMSVRSFLISGAAPDLAPYQIARTEIAARLADLRGLLDDATVQRGSLDQLGDQIAARQAASDSLIAGDRPIGAARRAAAVTLAGPPSDTLSALIVAMERSERDLLARRVALAEAAVQRVAATVAGVAALTFLSVLLAVLAVHQQIALAFAAGEERLRRAVIDAPFPVLVHTEGGQVLLASRAVGEITGYPPDEIATTPDWARQLGVSVPAGDGPRQREQRGEQRIRTRSGEQRIWSLRSVPIGARADGQPRLISMAVDLTERMQAERVLADYSARLRALSLRLVDVQESERRHIARELHDEIGQALTGLDLTMELALRSSGDDLHRHLRAAQGAVRELTSRVRSLSLDLRPSMLDDLGLVAALHWLFQRYTTQTQIEVTFLHHGIERRFHPVVETAAYRIIQEALTNAARHAHAPAVTVQLWGHPQRLGIQIEDAGAGFDPAAAQSARCSLGLDSMRERAELLGGALVIESALGRGTLILVDLPLEPAAESLEQR